MFNLDEYTTVRERIQMFWGKYPNGRIRTEILDWSDKRFIVLAEIYSDKSDAFPLSTGLANEIVGSSNVNRDFALENCATSALGIAIGNAGIGIEKQKASRDEMVKVVQKSKPLPNAFNPLPKQPIDEKDYWTTPIGEQDEMLKKVDAPVTMDQAVATVAEILIEDKMPVFCEHGQMQWKDGNKNGRAWGGYFCPSAGSTAHRCATEWYVLASNGTWEPQKARV